LASGGAGCRDRAGAGRCELTKLGQSRIHRHQFILDRILDEKFLINFDLTDFYPRSGGVYI
jgi:hypothetical protein